MAAPRNKPMNPDAQALLDQLLDDPAKASCPICGGTGFWDNRDDPKRPEKAPHWKCKNKACAGATPLKGKRPYGVWLPDDYVAPRPQPASRRAQAGLPANSHEAAVAPTSQDPEAPTFFFEDDPAPARQLGPKAGHREQMWETIERAYRWALDASYRAQAEATTNRDGGWELTGITPTMESVQAGAATLLIQAEKMGAIR